VNLAVRLATACLAISRVLNSIDLAQLETQLFGAGIQPLPVTSAHAVKLRDLPSLHRDPFDRMLVAQAMSEPLHLLTHDAALRPYSDLVVLV